MEELIEQLRQTMEMAAKLPPSMQSVHKNLADIYEKVKRPGMAAITAGDDRRRMTGASRQPVIGYGGREQPMRADRRWASCRSSQAAS